MTQQEFPQFIAVIPAGGAGSRFGAPVPKQYLTIAGQSMLSHTLAALLQCPWLDHVLVVTAAGHPSAPLSNAVDAARCTFVPVGGSTRRDSVLAGLRYIAAGGIGSKVGSGSGSKAVGPVWTMVHDAARPGLSRSLLEALRDAVLELHRTGAGENEGALLALPIADTVKRQHADAGGQPARVAQTVSRDGLWLAQTPQVFRLEPLIAALETCPGATDEAGAMERAGGQPVLVRGHWHNLKVTTPDDLALISAILQTGADNNAHQPQAAA